MARDRLFELAVRQVQPPQPARRYFFNGSCFREKDTFSRRRRKRQARVAAPVEEADALGEALLVGARTERAEPLPHVAHRRFPPACGTPVAKRSYVHYFMNKSIISTKANECDKGTPPSFERRRLGKKKQTFAEAIRSHQKKKTKDERKKI